MRERAPRAPVEWGVATRCRRGEATSGDLGLVCVTPGGALVAGIDGLGHGIEAARAADTAGDVIRESASADLGLLVERCHAALKGTRGAAISLAFISTSEGGLTWLGVGNVEGSLPLTNGIPGHELPRLRIAALDVQPGDVLVLATDGIESAFADSLDISGSPRAISERILAGHWKPSDDALVVAVRYLGVRP